MAIDPFIQAFDHALKLFASAFSGPSDKLKDVTEEEDHLRAYHSLFMAETDQVHQKIVPCQAGDAIVRVRSAPIPGRCASSTSTSSSPVAGQKHQRERRRSDPLIRFDAWTVDSMQAPTPPQDEMSGHLVLKKRPTDKAKSRSLSPDRCARLSTFYYNLGITDDVDKIEADFDRKRYDIAVAEVRAGEQQFRRCYDEVCALKRQMKRTRDIVSKHKSKADINKLEYLQKTIPARIDVMNRIEEKLQKQRDVKDGLAEVSNSDNSILTRRPSSSSSARVSWHPTVVCA
jgi:hypothetical protein